MSRALGTAGLGFALCLTGAGFDSPSLYVPGSALIGLAVVVTTWVRLAAEGARVERAAGPHTVVEDEPWPLRLRLNSGVLPPPGGELIEPLLGWPVPIGGRWSRRIRINVRFSRRGRRRLEPARLVVRDPLWLKSVEVVGEGGEELLVLPRIEPVEPVRASGSGSGADLGGADQGQAGGRLNAATAELDIDGLRPYREGAPASRIHWPAVARSGEMLERRLVAELDSAPLVVLDASHPASEEALDAAVRAAGSLCVELGRRGGCSVLLPHERRPTEIGPELAAWPQVHVRLAIVESGAGAPALGHRPRGGAVIWVTGSSARRPPKGLERVAAASCWLVSPQPLAGFTPVFTVAGCTGQRVDRVRRPVRPAPGKRAA